VLGGKYSLGEKSYMKRERGSSFFLGLIKIKLMDGFFAVYIYKQSTFLNVKLKFYFQLI